MQAVISAVSKCGDGTSLCRTVPGDNHFPGLCGNAGAGRDLV